MMFYLLHGDDEFTSREQLKKLRQQGNFEYNQDTYNGGEVDLITITATCNTMPFLAEQRLVVVEGLPKKRRGESAATALPEPGGGGEVDQTSTEKESTEKSGKAKKSKRSGKGSDASRTGFERG